MKNYFIVSLCKNGILGGGITADEYGLTYRTGKVTVDRKYRNLRMNFEDLASVSKGRLFLFPTVTLSMKNGEEYRFIVFFAKKRLMALLHDRKNNL